MSTPTATLEPQADAPSIFDTTFETAAPSEIPADFRLWRISVEQYHAMAEAGVLTENDPVELLEGWLVYKMTKKPFHSSATGFVADALRDALPAGWYVRNQEPITLRASEPEPDVAVIRGIRREYLGRHPSASEVALVVEVADSTLVQDRNSKKRIYARAGISFYWLVNLVDMQIEVYTNPTGPAPFPTYNEQRDYQIGDTLPVIVDGDEIGQLAVRDLLP